MKFKNILMVVLISSTSALCSVWGYNKWQDSQTAGIQQPGKLPVNYAGFFDNDKAVGAVDFTAASMSATPAVVHIKTRIKARQVTNNLPQRGRNPFSDLFGDDFGDLFGSPRSQSIPEQRASGSGVLISEDGYIVTNNHVIDGADEINITLNNRRSYKATVVGADPSTDIAVLKIDGKNFPYMVYGNSDDVKLGQWVLAVGYPLTLDVTVTAGIISAKSRSIGINRQSDSPIESFLQTDAAVNPGNSGGALINTSGQLIGINSAIASPTGSYAGYSYAVPVNIVKKAVNDLIKFGTVQRAYLGIQYSPDNLTDEQKKEAGIKSYDDGVYVTKVPEGGAASVAGIKPGDVVTKINGVTVNSGPEMVEQVTRYKPGDKVSLTYMRDGKENTVSLTLKNKAGNIGLVKSETIMDKLGGQFETLDKKTALKYDIPGGVLVKKIGEGGYLSRTKMQEGYVITSANGVVIKNLDDLKAVLEKNKDSVVKLEGIYPGYEASYGYSLNLSSDE